MSRSVADKLGLGGSIAAYERPKGMAVATFIYAPPRLLGEPVARADNVCINNFYIAVFNILGGSVTTTGLITAAYLAVGTTAPGTVSRADTGLAGAEWKRLVQSNAVVNAADPPNVTLSYFTPASDGAVNIGEVGICTAAAGGQFINHAAFSYNRPASQDVRFDVTLSRIAT